MLGANGLTHSEQLESIHTYSQLVNSPIKARLGDPCSQAYSIECCLVVIKIYFLASLVLYFLTTLFILVSLSFRYFSNVKFI